MIVECNWCRKTQVVDSKNEKLKAHEWTDPSNESKDAKCPGSGKIGRVIESTIRHTQPLS